MSQHSCRCQFVPPHVLDNLAKQGANHTRSRARDTAFQSKQARLKRANEKVPLTKFRASAAPAGVVPAAPGAIGDAVRKVYNCHNTWDQHVGPPSRDEGAPATGDQDTDLVYDYAGIVRKYFKHELNRASIDNQGMDLILNVHFGVQFMNAFWDGDEMSFGEGDGEIFVSFAKSLDVVAHELAHGVTQFTANLEYYSQSGALNEHFSDVFGSTITQFNEQQDAGTADWLIGDEIMGPTLVGEALRSMKAPGTAYDNALLGKDPQPDHMSQYFAGPEDEQGVHINSGIPNRAFYLVATSIGTPRAAKIWYHALQNLWPTATFADAVHVLVSSAQLLTKNNIVPIGSTQTVRSAFKAVGL